MQGVLRGRGLFGAVGAAFRRRHATAPPAPEAAEVAAGPSRRTLLKGGAVAAAGAVGWGAAAATSGGSAGASAAGTLELTGARWRAGSPGVGPGGLAAYGELLGPGGAVAGSFSATRLAVPATSGNDAPGAELQTFNLTEGSIFGLGIPPARGEGAASYAILGGTGAYAGAIGTYTADQRPLDRGGDGTAAFSFQFTTQGQS